MSSSFRSAGFLQELSQLCSEPTKAKIIEMEIALRERDGNERNEEEYTNPAGTRSIDRSVTQARLELISSPTVSYKKKEELLRNILGGESTHLDRELEGKTLEQMIDLLPKMMIFYLNRKSELSAKIEKCIVAIVGEEGLFRAYTKEVEEVINSRYASEILGLIDFGNSILGVNRARFLEFCKEKILNRIKISLPTPFKKADNFIPPKGMAPTIS